jgi:hypothetical protein
MLKLASASVYVGVHAARTVYGLRSCLHASFLDKEVRH